MLEEKLQLLVIHPHDTLMPGDIIDMTEDEYEARVLSHPFPYYSVIKGVNSNRDAGVLLAPAPTSAQLPYDTSPALPGTAAEAALEGLDAVTAMSGQLHAESYQSEVAPPFAAEEVNPVLDDSVPVTEPISAALEAPTPEATEPSAPVVEVTTEPEVTSVPSEAPGASVTGYVEVPPMTTAVEAVGGPPKAARNRKK